MMFSCKPEMTSWWFLRYGAPYKVLDDGFWKGDSKFTFLLRWHILPIFNRLRVIRPFHFGWDFPMPVKFVGFSGKMTPKKSKFWKTLAWRALPYVKLRFLSYCAWKSVHGLYAWLGKKKQKNNKNKRHASPIFHRHVGAPPLMRSQPNMAGLFIR